MTVHVNGQSVELGASSRVWIISIMTSVGVPLTDILDSSPRVSIGAQALEWRLYFMIEVPWGRASDPAEVAPEPLEEFLTPSRVISPNVQKRCRHLGWKVPIGSSAQGFRRTLDRASIIHPRLSS